MKNKCFLLLCFLLLCVFSLPVNAQDRLYDKKIPLNKQGYYNLLNNAINSLKIDDYISAEIYLKQAIKLKPYNWRAWQALSVVYSEQNMTEYARICAKNAYEINPDEPINKYTYGLFLENPQKVIAHYDSVTNKIVVAVNNDRNIVDEALKDKNIKSAVQSKDPNAHFQEIGNKILARVNYQQITDNNF